MPAPKRNPGDYIVALNMNGLQGRMLHVPAPKNKTKEIMFVYGHHSSLERWWGVIEDLNQYGAVTMPDLPGFGGMESFYKIGEKPTIDNYADYLAAFVKMRYKRKKVIIAGMSFGFVVATRMLQRYPDLTKKVELLVSVVGFMHKDDFVFPRSRYMLYRYGAQVFSYRLPAMLYKNIALHPSLLRTMYSKTHNAKHKFAGADAAHKKQLMDYEVHLWHANDLRTQMFTTVEFLTLNNCTKTIDLPVWHVAVKSDNYFNNQIIEQHMRVVFKDFHQAFSTMKNHAPTLITDKKQAAGLLPTKLRKVLAGKA